MLRFRHRTWFANVKVRGGGEYGNAVLTRFPIMEAQNIDVTIPPRKRRSVLHVRCRVRLDSGHVRTIHIYNMHLGLSQRERVLQIAKFFASHPFARLDPRAPIILAGDLNDVWGTIKSETLLPAGFRALDGAINTFPAYAPLRALDGVYVRGNIELVDMKTSGLAAARYASDHLPLIADVEIR
jgi:endonuclease/exonuclease/phosphatase family metal-dependent hydrolase